MAMPVRRSTARCSLESSRAFGFQADWIRLWSGSGANVTTAPARIGSMSTANGRQCQSKTSTPAAVAGQMLRVKPSSSASPSRLKEPSPMARPHRRPRHSRKTISPVSTMKKASIISPANVCQ